MTRSAAVPGHPLLAAAPRLALRLSVALTTKARKRPAGPALACACALLQSALALAQPAAPLAEVSRSLADFSLEELREVEVFSVTRRAQPLIEAPGSVYVIPGEQIRRMGITSLPEALRLAPNLQVAALDARQYAISARGFNSNIANKLLVMMDGRTIYSPLFSGVFWDAQEFVPADIDRIEVISGPAGPTWGTNAVNGVINIVTRSSADTQGPSLAATLGTFEKSAIARHGFALGAGATARVWAKTFERDATLLARGGDFDDAARGTAAGLRADWSGGNDRLMLSAALYEIETDSRPVYGPVELSGGHLLAHWSRRLEASTDFDLQAYYDRTDRKDDFLLQDDGDLFDVEAKLRHRVGRHRWLFGLGHRRGEDRAEAGLLFAFVPPEQRQKWYSAFVQDEILLAPRLTATLGLRLERNPYTGWESMPSLRLAWAPSGDSLIWAAASRAVRSPARLDREIVTPPQPPFIVAGGPSFRSEVADVLEIGYRVQHGASASWSVTAFVQDYDHLRSAQLVNGAFEIHNLIEGEVRGVEAWGRWQPLSNWRLDAGLLWLDKSLRLKPGSNDPVGPSNLGNDPRSQWSLRSAYAIREDLDFLLAVRRVGSLPAPRVRAYTATDLQLNWRVRSDLQLALGVRNAFDRRHVEFGSGPLTGEIPRTAFVAFTYQPK